MESFSCTELPIERPDILQLNQIRFHHPDPFHRLLIAQAARRPLYLAPFDQNIIKTFENDRVFRIFTDGAWEK
jgi:PIN domain nuclease of toxin-antitoxin system